MEFYSFCPGCGASGNDRGRRIHTDHNYGTGGNSMKVCVILLLAALLLCGCAAPAQPEPTTEATICVTEATEIPTLPPETEPPTIDTVPLYYQSDYPYIRYGDGTIASSGCGMASLAMAATYVTDQVYTPDMLVWEFGSYCSDNVQRVDYAIEQMQLPCEKNHNWQITKQALLDGKIAIIMVDERSIFTTGSHFMVLTGINEKGLYEVLDPFRPNHERDELLEGFEHGFMEWEIVTGLEGSWVFDKEAMGSFRYEINMPEPPKTRYVGFWPTELDMDYLARFVWTAARNESPETQQAVAELVLNRLCHHQFPNLVERVMRQDELYVFYRQMGDVQPGIEQYEAVTNAIYGPHILPLTVLHGAPWLEGAGKEWGKVGSFTFLYTVD